MVEDGENGYCIAPRSAQALADACIKFLNLSRDEKKMMARMSYEKCKRQFDVNLVIKKYEEIIFGN